MFSLLPAIYFQPEILQYWTHQPTKQKAEYHLFAAKLDYESNSFRNIKTPLSLWTLSFALSPIFATKKCKRLCKGLKFFFFRYKSLLFAKLKAPLMKLRARADWKRNIKFRREGLLLPPPSNIGPYHHISALFNFLVAKQQNVHIINLEAIAISHWILLLLLFSSSSLKHRNTDQGLGFNRLFWGPNFIICNYFPYSWNLEF